MDFFIQLLEGRIASEFEIKDLERGMKDVSFYQK
jgi:hypothetical protein